MTISKVLRIHMINMILENQGQYIMLLIAKKMISLIQLTIIEFKVEIENMKMKKIII